MRELVFTLDYRPGCNEVADTLANYPDAEIRSLSLHVTESSLWRVDHATGSPEALAAIEDAFLTSDYYADCLATDHCGATQTTHVLEHTDDTLVLYSYWERTPACASVPHTALDNLGEGALFETRHSERQYTWRIIHSGPADVHSFVDELERIVGDCATLDVRRLTDAPSPTDSEDDGLSPEQEAALQAAVEHGYYETPREVDVGELAERLDVPRSTLTYRLRRAETYLAKQHVSQRWSPDSGSPRI
ncbi:helix-turn-helix domain-containing protein [Natronoarchaeum sp. GCM10025703]|uniref:helix-turn-helix domain-containing protein n=1 Tax=unclassified Natronoarchaeum TaxID=2620183 RepID=UPI0036206AA4